MIETNSLKRNRTWLFFGVSAGLCFVVYWLGFSQEKYNDEITLAISACTLTGVYFIFVRPLSRALQIAERHQSELYNNLKLKRNEQDRSFLTYIYRVNLLFDQCRQFVGSLRSADTALAFDEEFRENDLVRALIDLKAETKLLSERESQRQWVSDSMSKFFELLKKKNEDNSDFYNSVLPALVKMLEANQGSLYLLSENESGEQDLELVACYAYDRKKFLKQRIGLGQGLVGQAYLEGVTLVLKQIPEHYIKITSGLGEALPRFLLIVPFKLGDRTECILELASFVEIPQFKVQFLEEVGESIASTIASSKTNDRMKALLAAAEANTEELRSQEEEMRQSMEELSATQEEMARKEKELVTMLETSDSQRRDLNRKVEEIKKLTDANENYKKDVIQILNSIPAKIFLKDKDGTMVLCNEEVANAYNLSLDQLIGTHDRDHFDPEQAKEFRKQELEVMNEGLKTYVQQERLNGKLRFFKTTKMPFYIHHLGQTGLLGYQFDVTELHNRNEVLSD